MENTNMFRVNNMRTREMHNKLERALNNCSLNKEIKLMTANENNAETIERVVNLLEECSRLGIRIEPVSKTKQLSDYQLIERYNEIVRTMKAVIYQSVLTIHDYYVVSKNVETVNKCFNGMMNLCKCINVLNHLNMYGTVDYRYCEEVEDMFARCKSMLEENIKPNLNLEYLYSLYGSEPICKPTYNPNLERLENKDLNKFVNELDYFTKRIDVYLGQVISDTPFLTLAEQMLEVRKGIRIIRCGIYKKKLNKKFSLLGLFK